MRAAWLWASFILMIFAGQSLAHEAEEASAGITIRDKAVEVRLNVELTSWIRNITGLSLTKDHSADLEPLLVLAANNLKQSVLKVGGSKVDLEIVQFPKADTIMHDVINHGHGHHSRVTILMRGALSTTPSGALSMELPREIGPIIMSVSHPRTAWVAAGTAGHFKLDDVHEGKKNSKPSPYPWLYTASALFAGLAGGFWFQGGRKSRPDS
jgi:hypothetical protein